MGIPYALFFMAGAGLGIFYFYGLWLTVKKIPVSTKPLRLLCCSAICRLGCTLLLLFLAASFNPLLSLLMLSGFWGVRYVILSRMTDLNRRLNHAA